MTETDLTLKNSKKQNPLHLAVQRNSINILPDLINTIKERHLKDAFTAKDEEGRCPVHIAARYLRQNIVNLLQKAAVEIGVETELKDTEGNTSEEIMRAVEEENTEMTRQRVREKDAIKAKKAEEKAAERLKEAKSAEIDKKLDEVKQLKEAQKAVDAEDAKKRAPYMLLMIVGIGVLLLYVLLKIGVATGATKRAAGLVSEGDYPEL